MRSPPKAVAHTAGALAYALLQWLVLAIAARAISLEAAGLYVYYLALLTPASILLSFGLRSAIASDVSHLHSRAEYTRARALGVGAFALYSAAVAFIAPDNLVIAAVVFAVKLLDLWNEVLYGEWIRTERGDRYGASKGLRLVLFAGLFGIVYGTGFRGEVLLACYPVAMLLGYNLYDRKHWPKADTSVAKGSLLALLRTSAPLAAGSFVVALTATLPRVIVKDSLGAESAALYAMLIYFVSLAVMPISSASQTFIPRLARWRSASLVAQFIVASVAYGVVFAVALVIFGEILVKALYGLGDSYSTQSMVAVAAASIAIFSTTAANATLVALRAFRATMYCSLIGVVSVVSITYHLVSTDQLDGAFLGYAIASWLTCISSWCLLVAIWLRARPRAVVANAPNSQIDTRYSAANTLEVRKSKEDEV